MSRSRGFTLIEVLVAMLIIGVTTPLVMGAIIGSLTQARRSQDRGAATLWAQGELDYLRRRCFRELGAGGRKVTPRAGQDGELLLPPSFPAAYISIEEETAGLRRVTVRLYTADWGAGAPPRWITPYLTATTYVADIRTRPACDRP